MATINPFALIGYLGGIEILNGFKFPYWKQKSVILDEDNVESFMSEVEEELVSPIKALVNTLMTKLLTQRYDGHCLRRFFWCNSFSYLPVQYDQFMLAYNTHKEKERLNHNKVEVAYLAEASSGRNRKL
ncbi:hypothetical protein AMTRI_Chr03g142790 [Amborella trichopoda]